MSSQNYPFECIYNICFEFYRVKYNEKDITAPRFYVKRSRAWRYRKFENKASLHKTYINNM